MSSGNGNGRVLIAPQDATLLEGGFITRDSIVVTVPHGHPLSEENMTQLLQAWCDQRDQMIRCIEGK